LPSQSSCELASSTATPMPQKWSVTDGSRLVLLGAWTHMMDGM
jgi:hypothetical protein